MLFFKTPIHRDGEFLENSISLILLASKMPFTAENCYNKINAPEKKKKGRLMLF